MGSGSIGIKLADNKFFPVIDDGVEGSKTIELTTVSQNQGNVQIHLYRSKENLPGQSIDSTEYIGTLVIEDIAEKPAGIPTIRLKITLNGEGDLSAEAIDVDSGTHQSLNVSLKNLSGQTLETSSDFDITGIDADADGEKEHATEKKGISPWLCSLILAVGIGLLAAALFFAWKFFFDDGSGGRTPIARRPPASQSARPDPASRPQPAPATSARETSPYPELEQESPDYSVQEEPTPPPVWQENTEAVATEPVPPAIPDPAPSSQNVYYLIKWGDTLWDLAETYYRNPWRYSYIARYNSISNPNLIIAGTYIIIPAE